MLDQVRMKLLAGRRTAIKHGDEDVSLSLLSRPETAAKSESEKNVSQKLRRMICHLLVSLLSDLLVILLTNTNLTRRYFAALERLSRWPQLKVKCWQAR